MQLAFDERPDHTALSLLLSLAIGVINRSGRSHPPPSIALDEPISPYSALPSRKAVMTVSAADGMFLGT